MKKSGEKDLEHCEEMLRRGKEDCPDVLYKYLGSKGAKLTLTDGKLRFTPPNVLNDLFECLPACIARSRQLSKREVGEFLVCQYEANPARFKVPPQIVARQLAQWRSGIVTDKEIAKIRKIVSTKKFINSNGVSNEISILSLSSCPDTILMWTHYAENGKGVVLGLRTQYFNSPLQVKYRKSRIRMDLRMKLSSEYRVLSTKFTDWKYEHEWRIIAQNSGLEKKGEGIFLYDMPEDLVACVIIGPRTSPKLKSLARTFAYQNGCDIKIAKMHPRKYKLDIVDDNNAVKPED